MSHPSPPPYSRLMDRPNPDGWKGGREDFTFLRTLDGHRTLGEFDDDQIADMDRRRNARSTSDAISGNDTSDFNLSGTDYDA